MARPKSMWSCAICDATFESQAAYFKHKKNHPDAASPQPQCVVCKWPFEDSLALENHCIQSGHSKTCENCSATFRAVDDYDTHVQFPSKCSDAFRDRKTSAESGQASISTPTPLAPQVFNSHSPEQEEAQTKIWIDDEQFEGNRLKLTSTYCGTCERSFKTPYQYNNHFLSCRPTLREAPTQYAVPAIKPEVDPPAQSPAKKMKPRSKKNKTPPGNKEPAITGEKLSDKNKKTRPGKKEPALTGEKWPHKNENVPPSSSVPSALFQPSIPKPSIQAFDAKSTTTDAAATFVCKIGSCNKIYQSAKGLQVHQADAHGKGGKALDLLGKDSFMLPGRIREQYKNAGLLTQNPSPARGRGNRVSAALARPLPPAALPPPVIHNTSRKQPPVQQTELGSAAEMEQAKLVCDKILRLVLQSDIFLHHDGKISAGGIDWTRIGVAKQVDLVSVFDGLCHLPKALQGEEYLPRPVTFVEDFQVSDDPNNFRHSPPRCGTQPAMGVIALSCSSIVVGAGHEEIVKVAAVDVATCRVLLNHLVCPDPKSQVTDWRTGVTGLSSFHDIEAARNAGYKVLKGWKATREALWKFADTETIIVGHNLRTKLDALRMIHGRGVDVVKLVEKAANGPLSKVQLSLESLSRDYPEVRLFNDPTYGRDCIQDAFAARELALWIIKNGDQLKKRARQKSLDYQRANPGTRT